LAAHFKAEGSQLVLPETLFAPWFALSPRYDALIWQAAVVAHAAWLSWRGRSNRQ